MKTISRRDLYDLVWSKSISTISKETNIKESIIRGICQTYRIPLPINGYWSKVQFGKEVEVFPFVEEFDGSDVIDLYHFETTENEINRKNQVEIIGEFVNEKLPNYPTKLENPLEVILQTKKMLTKKDWYSYYQETTDDTPNVSVEVSPIMFDRSLLFLDTLLKQFINRGHIIESKRGSTKIIIQKQSIPIRLRESYNRVKKSNPKLFDSEDKVVNGILCFQIDESYNRIEWKDSNSSKLEDKIPNIIAKIEDICYKRHREELERVREKVRKEEIYHLIQARKKVIEIHLSKFNKLLRETARHKKIMDMRAYIDSLKKYENGSPEMKEWIEWATSATNWYDPLVKFEHPYLKDVDRDTLSIKTLDSEIENWYNSYNTHDYGEDNEWDLNMEFMTDY